jgi:hypothetical protein
MYWVPVFVHGGACRRGRIRQQRGGLLMTEDVNLDVAFESYEESYEPLDKHLGFVERVQG